MTATYSQHSLSGYPLITRKRKRKAVEAKSWGTPTAEELEGLLGVVQKAVEEEGALVRRFDAILLLSSCHTMLRRCQIALAPAAEARGEEVAA